jgi:hypothetical protein
MAPRTGAAGPYGSCCSFPIQPRTRRSLAPDDGDEISPTTLARIVLRDVIEYASKDFD